MQQTQVSSQYSELGLRIVTDLANRLVLKISYQQENTQNISAVVSWHKA